MSWYYLLLAAVVEAVYGIAVFHSKGFTLAKPTALAICAAATTTYLLALAMRGIPAGVSFLVWSGIASLGVVTYGVIALDEPLGLARLAMMALIIIGVGGLKLLSPA